MKHNVFPMKEENGITTLHLVNLSHISHFVEVNQLGYQDDGKIWVHTDPISGRQPNISPEVIYFSKHLALTPINRIGGVMVNILALTS